MGAGFPAPALDGRRLSSHTITSPSGGGFGLRPAKPKSRIHQSLPVITQFKIKAQGKNAMTPECFPRRLFKVYCVIGARGRHFAISL